VQNLLNEVGNNLSGLNRSLIGINSNIKGKIIGSEDVVFEGSFSGNIDINGTIFISSESKVTANIKGNNIICYGRVVGNISCNNKIHIKKGSFVEGDMEAPHIIIEDGAKVKGRVNIL